MKKIMKKSLSLMLIVAMLLVPMTAWAANFTAPEGTGTAADPYVVSADGTTTYGVTIEANGTVFVQLDDYNATINGVASTQGSYSLLRSRTEQPVVSDGAGVATITLVESNMFMIVNNVETANVVIFTATAGGASNAPAGTVDDPEVVVLEENPRTGALGAYVQKELAAGNQGYYYTVKAPANGSIVVSMYGASDAEGNEVGWTYFVNNKTAGKYGDNHWSDDSEVVAEETISVSKDDEIVVFVATYDPSNMFSNPAGTVYVNIGFNEEGSQNCPEVVTEGTYAADIEAGSQGYHYKWVAEKAGTVTVTMNDAEGWTYVVNNLTAYKYGDTHWYDDDSVVASEKIEVAAGDEISIMVNTYDPNNMWSNPAGKVNWTLSFEAGSGSGDTNPDDGNQDDTNPDDGNQDVATYIESETLLELGEKEYAVDNAYTYTIYIFAPTEVGKYTITSADSKMGIVGYYWVEENKLTENVVCEDKIVWNCTAVGQELYIAVKSDADAANISIVQGEVEDTSIPITDYVNKVKPQAFTFTANANDLIYVDTFDGVVDKAVLGEDGYYHLNSADGPVLFVDLDDEWNSLAAMNDLTKLSYVLYEDGVAVAQTIYNNAFIEYYACADEDTGLYPLTEDLMTIYQYVGIQNDWYSGDGVITLGDDEDAWMYACYYVEGLNTLGNATQNGPVDGVVDTGDSTNIVLWVSVLGLGVVAVAAAMVMKKKSI